MYTRSMPKFIQEQVDALNSEITITQEALVWASDNLYPKVAKASSFGAEDVVVMDMMLKINPKFRFFTLDTERLPEETHEIIDTVKKSTTSQSKSCFLIWTKLRIW